jgi:hypothetical protein
MRRYFYGIILFEEVVLNMIFLNNSVKQYMIIVLLFIASPYVMAQLGLGQIKYFPDIKVTYAFADTPFSEAITTEEKLLLDKPFYIMIEARITVSGIGKLFAASSIDCAVSFQYPQIIKVSSVETTTAIRILDKNAPNLVYAFRIPVNEPLTHEGQRATRVIFHCNPLNTGQQEIILWFDKNVDKNYRPAFNFSIKGN